ncbi:hypothetical protein ABBQ38_004678 [Trebouxia sp. C0009 RCD-2024]
MLAWPYTPCHGAEVCRPYMGCGEATLSQCFVLYIRHMACLLCTLDESQAHLEASCMTDDVSEAYTERHHSMPTSTAAALPRTAHKRRLSLGTATVQGSDKQRKGSVRGILGRKVQEDAVPRLAVWRQRPTSDFETLLVFKT